MVSVEKKKNRNETITVQSLSNRVDTVNNNKLTASWIGSDDPKYRNRFIKK